MEKIEFQKFFIEFMAESDRAAIVLGAAQMDDLLTGILKKRLISPRNELFEFNGPFGTFSAKIDTAYAVGVITKNFSNKIHLVRKIRNECAHNVCNVDLDSGAISQQIELIAGSYKDTSFWREYVGKAEIAFGKSNNALVLRLAISCLVAKLAHIKSSVRAIDGSAAEDVFLPTNET